MKKNILVIMLYIVNDLRRSLHESFYSDMFVYDQREDPFEEFTYEDFYGKNKNAQS